MYNALARDLSALLHCRVFAYAKKCTTVNLALKTENEIECDCLLLQKLNPDPEFRTNEYNKKIEVKYLLVTKFVSRCKDR